MYYGKRLAEMIRCKTISKKDSFEPEEFMKLREVIKELFPVDVGKGRAYHTR